MSASAKGKQQKQVRQLQCQEQCIGHIAYYLSGLSRAHFFRQPFSKQLYSVHSSSKPVLPGVPQGSILGPVLFLWYISDISSHIQSNLRLFADDCIFYGEINDLQDYYPNREILTNCHLGQRPDNQVWYYTCKKLLVAHCYLLNNEIVLTVSSAQYLVITVSDNLSWNENVNNICKKANSARSWLTTQNPEWL